MIRILFALMMILSGAHTMSAQSTVQLLSPIGGESFAPGDTVEIRWAGGGAALMRLDYSTDSGSTWRRITDSATGGRYAWMVPNTPSTRCLFRITHLTKDSSSVALNGEPSVLEWPYNGPANMSFSPDGSRLMTISKAGQALLWDTRDGNLLLRIPAVKERQIVPYTAQAVFSPNGQHIALSFSDKIIIHDAATGDTTTVIMGAVAPMIFSPDGRYILGKMKDINAIAAWDVTTATLVDTVAELTEVCTVIAVSPNGQLLATGATDGLVRIYQIATGKKIWNFTHAKNQRISSVAFSPDGLRTCAVSSGPAIRQWDNIYGPYDWNNLSGVTLPTVYGLGPPYAIPYGARYSNDGTRIMAALRGQIVVFNFAGNSILNTVGNIPAKADPTLACFSNDDHHGAIVYADGTGKIWTFEREEGRDSSKAVWTIEHMAVTATLMDFGETMYPGGWSEAYTIITNHGKLPLKLIKQIKEGGNGNGFRYQEWFPWFPIQPGKYAGITFRFYPPSPGLHEATFLLIGEVDTIRVPARGVGVLRPIQPATSTVYFPGVAVGSYMDTTVKIATNLDTIPWYVTMSMIESPDSMQFSIIAGTDTMTVLPGDSLSVGIRYHPTSLSREYRQAISIGYDGRWSPVSIPLVGNSRLLGVAEDRYQDHSSSLSSAISDPSGRTIHFTYDIAKACHARLTLFDAIGRRIMPLLDEYRQPGHYVIDADISELPAGFYFYTLEAGTEQITQKVIVVR